VRPDEVHEHCTGQAVPSSGEPDVGDEVLVPRGFIEVIGSVAEVYGYPGRRRPVVLIEPETSGFVVDSPTTIAVNLADLLRPADDI
jgi:hypothetical protein